MLTALYLLIRVGDYWRIDEEVGREIGGLKAKVIEADKLLPPITGWEFWGGSNPSIECSREVSSAIEKWERRKEEERVWKEEKRRKEEEERIRKGWEPLAAEVDTAAKKRDLARVKQLQQLETGGIVMIIISINI